MARVGEEGTGIGRDEQPSYIPVCMFGQIFAIFGLSRNSLWRCYEVNGVIRRSTEYMSVYIPVCLFTPRSWQTAILSKKGRSTLSRTFVNKFTQMNVQCSSFLHREALLAIDG